MSSTTVCHPIFARLYDKLSVVAEAAGSPDHRTELLAGLRGRVIDIGAGTSLNIAHYPSEVSEVVTVEPAPHLRPNAVEDATSTTIRVTVIDATASELPHENATYDAAVYSLVLCASPTPPRRSPKHTASSNRVANCASTNTSRPTLPASAATD